MVLFRALLILRFDESAVVIKKNPQWARKTGFSLSRLNVPLSLSPHSEILALQLLSFDLESDFLGLEIRVFYKSCYSL